MSHILLEHGSIHRIESLRFGYHSGISLDNGPGGIYLSPNSFSAVTRLWTGAAAEKAGRDRFFVYDIDYDLEGKYIYNLYERSLLEQVAILYFCRCELYEYRNAENFAFFSRFPTVKEILRSDCIIGPCFDDSYKIILQDLMRGKSSLNAAILALHAGFLGSQFFQNSTNVFPYAVRNQTIHDSAGMRNIWIKDRTAIMKQIKHWKEKYPISETNPSLLSIYNRPLSDLSDEKLFSQEVLMTCRNEKIEKFRNELHMLIASRKHDIRYDINDNLVAPADYSAPRITAQTAAFVHGYRIWVDNEHIPFPKGIRPTAEMLYLLIGISVDYKFRLGHELNSDQLQEIRESMALDSESAECPEQIFELFEKIRDTEIYSSLVADFMKKINVMYRKFSLNSREDVVTKTETAIYHEQLEEVIKSSSAIEQFEQYFSPMQ